MNDLINKINRLLRLFLVPLIYGYLYLLSFKNYLNSISKADIVKVYRPHQSGQPILVIALFEKTYLRKDIIRLLEASNQAGLYVIAVNTRKLSDKFLQEHHHLFGVCITQYNYGRDFASYQKGFLYVFRNKLQQDAGRIVMLNDSLYYDADRTPKFLDDMINAPVEVLGATENYEISYHLGSFAISFAKEITNNKKFIEYWKGYRRTDIRPLVIKRGEMGLSKMLAKIVSNEFEMKALYDAQLVRNFLQQSNENLINFTASSRDSDLVDWPKLSHVELLDEFLTHTKIKSIQEKKIKQVNFSNDEKISTLKLVRTGFSPNNMHITSIEDIHIYLNRIPGKADDIYDQFRQFAINRSVSVVRHGSQIHQNNACFMLIGLPIIKLDGIYRGMFSEIDIGNFQNLMRPEYFNEVIEILYKKPYGGDVLKGWKLVAFYRGLI